MRSQTKERLKDIAGAIGVVLLLLFFIRVIISGSTTLQKVEDQCAARGGKLDREYICIQQPK